MTPKEWHLQALSCARRALFEYQVANQAMYDCRRAVLARQAAETRTGTLCHDDTHTIWADNIAVAGGDIPPRLQELVNALERDSILDEPKDIHSAGDCDEDEDPEDHEPIAEADAAETFARNCERRRREAEPCTCQKGEPFMPTDANCPRHGLRR